MVTNAEDLKKEARMTTKKLVCHDSSWRDVKTISFFSSCVLNIMALELSRVKLKTKGSKYQMNTVNCLPNIQGKTMITTPQ